MKNLPGQYDIDTQKDIELLNSLKSEGYKKHNVRVHWQNVNCVAFPGTRLYEETMESFPNVNMSDLDVYDGITNTASYDNIAQLWKGDNFYKNYKNYTKL